MTVEYTRDYARTLDAQDPLHAFRDEFYLNENAIYMDGNSLGLLSKRAEQTTYQLLESWKEFGIDGWTEGANPWYYLCERLGEKLTGLVGAKKEEVIVTGSTTVNLHHLVSTFYKPQGKQTKILADTLNFPSDIYALKAQLKLKGHDENHLIQVDSEDGHFLDENDIIQAMTDDIALIVLPSVLYRSGQILDMEKLTSSAHERGIKIGFDLCHSVGALPHHLHDWNVDFAFWCTYKYLNGGPGSVGGLFLHEKHFGIEPGLAGWFSSNKEKQFDMEHELTHAGNARSFQIGTPHVLSAAPLIGALEIFKEAGIENIRNKSLKLTEYMMSLINHELHHFNFKIRNPINSVQRGGHVFLEHPEAARICKALKTHGVIPDFRMPSGVRLAPVALYNSFEDVYDCVHILKSIMENKEYEHFEKERSIVS